jgi:hypothetical protein
VAFATFYLLDDAQFWFQRMELNGGHPTWPQFLQLMNAWSPPLTDSPIGELAMLRRAGIIDEFSKSFIILSCRDTSITEAQQIQLFITSLGDPLRIDIALQQPLSLDDAIIFARAYEQRNALRDAAQLPPTRSYRQSALKTASPPTPLASSGGATLTTTTTIPSASVVQLSLAEIAQRRKDGKCFCCDEPYVQGHKKHCKQLFVIEVVAEEDRDEQDTNGAEPTISLHALTNIQPRSGHTMQVYILINGAKLWVCSTPGQPTTSSTRRQRPMLA